MTKAKFCHLHFCCHTLEFHFLLNHPFKSVALQLWGEKGYYSLSCLLSAPVHFIVACLKIPLFSKMNLLATYHQPEKDCNMVCENNKIHSCLGS